MGKEHAISVNALLNAPTGSKVPRFQDQLLKSD
jgi:hypothetical protein